MMKGVYGGIDGEGQTDASGNHRYTLLAACSEDSAIERHVANPLGLSTTDCLDFMLELPGTIRTFSYSFNYDLTKLLADLPDKTLYELFRPELRPGERGPICRHWPDPRIPLSDELHEEGICKKSCYRLNLQGTKFTVTKGKRRRVIWDVFKFYQSKYVTALTDWKVGSVEEIQRIEEMKNKRSEFDKLPFDQVLAYCLDECRKLGTLVRKLVEAHAACGLELKKFYGAGSTASCILKKLNIGEKRRVPPEPMTEPVMQSFFGGRFEHSVIGVVPGPIHNRDISSAYPYQLAFLPCLEHGNWRLTKKRSEMERARAALVRYALPAPDAPEPWAPFPFRERDGSIVYPSSSGGGWVWRDEYLAGEKVWPRVGFVAAWILESDCKCLPPFAEIPMYYKERLRIGKEGPGIVLKLGPNSCYGKLAQSVGQPPFQCWIWASMITSGCRAQALDLMGCHESLWNVLGIATDGLFSTEYVDAPVPKDTGTYDCIDVSKPQEGKKPLGGWEHKKSDRSVFFARPGIYFPESPTKEELSKIRARGIGRAAMLEGWHVLLDAWKEGKDTAEMTTVSRFHGGKSSISYGPKSKVYTRSENYGQWRPRPIECSFSPWPKREDRYDKGKDYSYLMLRRVPSNLESAPYKRAVVSPEALQLMIAQAEMAEQPDEDFEDWND